MKKLRLSSRFIKGERITLEANPSKNPHAIYDLLDKLGRSVQLKSYNVTQTELTAAVVVDAEKPPKRTTIRITYPNSCSLKYDELGLNLRDMLEASGSSLRNRTKKTMGLNSGVWRQSRH